SLLVTADREVPRGLASRCGAAADIGTFGRRGTAPLQWPGRVVRFIEQVNHRDRSVNPGWAISSIARFFEQLARLPCRRASVQSDEPAEPDLRKQALEEQEP